ncbi:Scr1 family TA system antitoxin-like transcriptional regulator [Streptomyces bobili]|uniref:Scr1 family TA system antitoxin-like transcriptional regulator n=1 Tax=Streptomyces bobili TaxID=67280 RepID=UPI00341C2780
MEALRHTARGSVPAPRGEQVLRSVRRLESGAVDAAAGNRDQRHRVVGDRGPVLVQCGEIVTVEGRVLQPLDRSEEEQSLGHRLAVGTDQVDLDVRVIPFRAGAFPGAGQAVIYAEGPVPQLDTVELDSAHGPEFLHGQSQLDKYRAHLDWMETASLPQAPSRDFMHSIASHF